VGKKSFSIRHFPFFIFHFRSTARVTWGLNRSTNGTAQTALGESKWKMKNDEWKIMFLLFRQRKRGKGH